MAAVIRNNSIMFHTGASISIETGGKLVEFVEGEKKSKFLALFDCDDVDFEIVVENNWILPGRVRGLGVDILTATKENGFCLRPEEVARFETLENKGGKFHFISQNSDGGRQLVGTAAKLLGTSKADASDRISLLKFRLEVEKIPDYVNTDVPELKGDVIVIFIRTLSGKEFSVAIGVNNEIRDLKRVIEYHEHIPIEQQRILLEDKIQGRLSALKNTNDTDVISDCGIFNGSRIVYMVLRLRGGGELPRISPKFHPATAVFEDSEKEDKLCPTENLRGAVCFGNNSNQLFGPLYNFAADEEIVIQPIEIELMLKTKLTL